MSVFYDTMNPRVAKSFKARKKKFKHGKPCAICGKKYPPEKMMVAHIKPAYTLSDFEALYNEHNWQVRCINCERKMNYRETYHGKRSKE